MTKYQEHYHPQKENIFDQAREDQVQAHDGGYVFEADDWARLDRFLILGTAGGSYYATERELSKENAKHILPLIKGDGVRVVRRVVEISTERRAPKNDEALYVLALAAAFGDDATRREAFDSLPEVARIGTHLFQFVDYVQEYRGWGSGLQKAVARWYTEKDPDQLAYQMLKYRSRHGFSHADVLNLAHPRPPSNAHEILFARAVADQYGDKLEDRYFSLYESLDDYPSLLDGFEMAQRAGSVEEIVPLIEDFGLTREMIPTEFLSEPEVWEVMLQDMPIWAMVRNLGNMTRIGLLSPMSDAERLVTSRLRDEEFVQGSKIHPIQILTALITYQQGGGFRSSNTWQVNGKVVDALDEAFYTSFGNVDPTGKRTMLALDVSGSMVAGAVAGVPGLNPRIASAAMALVTANVEDQYLTVAFTAGSRRNWGRNTMITELPITPRQRLDDAVGVVSDLPFGRTNCEAPMKYALENGLDIDTFIIYTDSETNYQRHPFQVLQEYRQKTGIPAKLVVVGMVANRFSIADPNDPGMLDVVGFDTATPQIISEFSRS